MNRNSETTIQSVAEPGDVGPAQVPKQTAQDEDVTHSSSLAEGTALLSSITDKEKITNAGELTGRVEPEIAAAENRRASEELVAENAGGLSPDNTWDEVMAPFLKPHIERALRVARDVPASAELPAEKLSRELPGARGEEGRRPPTLLSFYGLQQQPFDVTPDPAYLYKTRTHREAFSALSLGVENLRGFMALIAEPGMGKTTLLNKLMEELRDSARVVFLFQTQCNSTELLRYLLNELEVEYDATDLVGMHRALSQSLFEEMLHGRRFVLIVDEAQNLQDSVLETIRLLSDYETTHSKLIQIILAGQPQLVETLLRPGLVQLRQRVAVLAHLESLDALETAEYIKHRLTAAGWKSNAIFTPDALELIAELSGGIPRSINNLCFNAMLAGYLQRQETVDAETLRKVASQMDLEKLIRRPQQDAPSGQPATATTAPNPESTAELARALVALTNGIIPTTPGPNSAQESRNKPSVSVHGKIHGKIRSQSWGKNESRIDISLERDIAAGVLVADRHYCCSLFVSEEQASTLKEGKPIRIKIEQD